MAIKKMSEVKNDTSLWMHKSHKIQRLIWFELLRASVGEFFATFFFIGAVLAAIINAGRLASSQGDLGGTGAIAVGLAVAFAGTATCWAFGDVSGSMFNPAITFGFLIVGKMTLLRGVCYMVAQFAGAIAAAGIMYLVFPANLEGYPSVSALISLSVPLGVEPVTALFMEGFLTFCLVYVVFATAVDRMAPLNPMPTFLPTAKDIKEKIKERGQGEEGLSAIGGLRKMFPKIRGRVRAGHVVSQVDCGNDANNENIANEATQESVFSNRYIQVYTNNGTTKRDWAPLAIGITLGFMAFLGSSVTGGGFNPARALATALLSDDWNSIYVYIVGPFVGGLLAALLHTLVFAFEGATLSAIPEDKAVKKIIKQEQQQE